MLLFIFGLCIGANVSLMVFCLISINKNETDEEIPEVVKKTTYDNLICYHCGSTKNPKVAGCKNCGRLDYDE